MEYNIFRWYRAGWGRYTQSDPLALYEPTLFLRERMPNAYWYSSANPIRFIDVFGLQSSSCCECPGKIWSYDGGSGGFGFLVGFTYAKGTFTCESKPELKVKVKTTCVQKGFFVNFGAAYDTSAVPMGIPAAKACNAIELYDPDPSPSVFGNFGPFGAAGSAGAGTVSAGISLGLGFGVQDCYTNPD